MSIDDPILIDLFRSAARVVVFTGAGVSAESGVPTFRNALTGHWAKFDPAELATTEAYERNPEMVSRWYDGRRCEIGECRPNAGHLALAEFERRVVGRGGRFMIATQNIDRLHQAGGSKSVIELHGTLWVWRCMDCGEEGEERGPAFVEYPPRCACGGMRRPGVVWFGEALPEGAIELAEELVGACDLLLSLGTSSVVYPAAGLIDAALQGGAQVLEVNPEATAYSGRVHWSIRGKSGEVLPELMGAAFG